MSDYPKYQLSKFLDAKRNYQVVVRTDNFDELLECMKQIKPLVDGIETKEATNNSSSSEDVICQYHGVKMFKTPKMKSHAHKDDQRGWCNGAGYPDERASHREKVYQRSEDELPAKDVSSDVPF